MSNEWRCKCGNSYATYPDGDGLRQWHWRTENLCPTPERPAYCPDCGSELRHDGTAATREEQARELLSERLERVQVVDAGEDLTAIAILQTLLRLSDLRAARESDQP